jgi:hypothetical protein
VKTEDGGIYRGEIGHLRSSKKQFELNDPNVEMKDDSCVRSNETSYINNIINIPLFLNKTESFILSKECSLNNFKYL